MATEQSHLDEVIEAEMSIPYFDSGFGITANERHALIELAMTTGFLDIVHLRLEGILPTRGQKVNLSRRIQLPTGVMNSLRFLPAGTDPMDALRTGISLLAGYDEDIENERAYWLIAQIPTIVAYSFHLLHNQEPFCPRSDLSYCANLLYMIKGREPTLIEERIFERTMVLHSEDNVTTFPLIHSDLYGALTGEASATKGYCHEEVIRMLLAGEDISGFEMLMHQNLQQQASAKDDLFRKKPDPRSLIMKEALYELSELSGNYQFYEMCEAGEQMMQYEKGLYPNLYYYSAPIYWMLGIPVELYSSINFIARVPGLCAPVIKQHEISS